MARIGRRFIWFMISLLAFNFHHLQWRADSQMLIPAKLDGFVYGNNAAKFNPNSVLIEAFLDPVCPDSRDSWPTLVQALRFYAHRVSLIVHPFALPYHDNAFVTSQALHIVNKLNSSSTYPLLEAFFQNQVKFYNQPTSNMSRTDLISCLIKFISESVNLSSYDAIQSGFSERESNIKTRVSFKYGCSRGVYGTPFFFVNGFALADPGKAMDYEGWRRLIDPLVAAMEEASLHMTTHDQGHDIASHHPMFV